MLNHNPNVFIILERNARDLLLNLRCLAGYRDLMLDYVIRLGWPSDLIADDGDGPNGSRGDQTGAAQPKVGALHSLQTHRFSKEATGNGRKGSIARTSSSSPFGSGSCAENRI